MVSEKQVVVGDVLKIHNWYGVVLEVHRDSATGDVSVLRVQTTRNVLRGYGPEYIDIRMNPEAVEIGTMDELVRDLEDRKQLSIRLEQQMLQAVAPVSIMEPS
ncbi:MAG: hypothetical protein KBG20_19685 [Caldilineaceae bacterium]|nr:hypothetical protein [Caldilineaceae bacterium]MBP8109529.1 hypothetical protein [Caldilineaceae bacterium]MBP8124751.1 hypothetical protein [Caldilineaceae bacterium]MBP9074540.1 hypothetical protein [Caldilineaceae bacterium]